MRTDPIPRTMQAVVYRGVNDLRVETVPVPRCGAHEVLVKVAACGVCPTDIKKIQHGTVPAPRILGHETAGTLVKVGARVEGWVGVVGVAGAPARGGEAAERRRRGRLHVQH